MAEKKNQPNDIFDLNITVPLEGTNPPRGKSNPFLGETNSSLEESTPLLDLSHHFDSQQPLIVINECSSVSQSNRPDDEAKEQTFESQRDQKGTNYPYPFLPSSWKCLEQAGQSSQISDERCPCKRSYGHGHGCIDNQIRHSYNEPRPEAGFQASEDAHLNPIQTGISDICWEDYKSFLIRVWKENSLDNSSLDNESSTLPSISSLSDDIPYVIELLTKEEELLLPNRSSEKSTLPNRPSEKSPLPNSPSTTQASPYGSHLMDTKQSIKTTALGERRNSPIINLQSFSILKKNFQPRPLSKETTNTLQGEATKRPTLFLRSNVLLEPLKEGGSSLPSAQKPFKKPLNIFSKRDHKVAVPLTPNSNEIYQSSSNKANDEKLNMPLTDREKPVFAEYKAGMNKSQLNQTPFQERALCFHGSEIENLKAELEKAQSRIASLSFKMEDQCSHLERLVEERNALQQRLAEFLQPQSVIPDMTYPLFPQQGYKAPHLPMYPSGMETYTCNPHHQSIGRRASCQYACDLQRGRIPSGYKGPEHHADLMSHLTRTDPRALEDLRDRIVALQMQNIELNLFLKKEEVRRKDAEDAVRKEKEYVRKLQESIQDISSSTLVIDPLTYKQVADNYIASKKTPVRRTHTCNPYIGSSDLVCDSNRLQVISNKTQSTSCPSSPLGSNHERKTSSGSKSPSSENHLQNSSPACSRYNLGDSDLSETTPSLNWSMEVQGSSPPVSMHQYQELLSSLDGLQVSSSPS